MLNPLRSFRILFYKDSFLVLLVSGIFYLIYYYVQASINTNELKEIYRFDESIIGACYLTIGVGAIIGGFVNGKFGNTLM